MIIKRILLCLVLLIFLFCNCSKDDPEEKTDPLDRLVTVHGIREDSKKTVRWCIDNGVVTRGMTIEECEKSLGTSLKIKIKLEDNWAIYNSVDKEESWEIFFNDGVVSSQSRLLLERIIKVRQKLKGID